MHQATARPDRLRRQRLRSRNVLARTGNGNPPRIGNDGRRRRGNPAGPLHQCLGSLPGAMQAAGLPFGAENQVGWADSSARWTFEVNVRTRQLDDSGGLLAGAHDHRLARREGHAGSSVADTQGVGGQITARHIFRQQRFQDVVRRSRRRQPGRRKTPPRSWQRRIARGLIHSCPDDHSSYPQDLITAWALSPFRYFSIAAAAGLPLPRSRITAS